MDWQYVVVAVVLGWAVAYLIRVVRRALRSRGCCSTDCACAGESADPLADRLGKQRPFVSLRMPAASPGSDHVPDEKPSHGKLA